MTAELVTLHLSWGVSRGRDTYGYNIRRLRDQGTGRTFRCMGGGYDMTGTVLADWVTGTYPDKLTVLAPRADWSYGEGSTTGRAHNDAPDTLYGLGAITDPTGNIHMALDGACGESSVWRVLNAAGFELVQRMWDRNGNTTGWIVAVPS